MNGRLSNLRRRDFLKLAAVGGLALSVPVIGSRLGPQSCHEYWETALLYIIQRTGYYRDHND